MIKIKKELKVYKSNFPEDGEYILFLHNSTKNGDSWRRLFKGSRKECILFKKSLLNGKAFQF